VIAKRKTVSEEATAKHAADVALAGQFDDLLAEARADEDVLRSAQADGSSLAEQHVLGKRLDASLTAVMRAAFAAERAAIGPRGYDDRIYRRKAMATTPVRAWTMEAQQLLTMRESHRLTGIVRLPPRPPSDARPLPHRSP
jgi:hypothetical protein